MHRGILCIAVMLPILLGQITAQKEINTSIKKMLSTSLSATSSSSANNENTMLERRITSVKNAETSCKEDEYGKRTCSLCHESNGSDVCVSAECEINSESTETCTCSIFVGDYKCPSCTYCKTGISLKETSFTYDCGKYGKRMECCLERNEKRTCTVCEDHRIQICTTIDYQISNTIETDQVVDCTIFIGGKECNYCEYCAPNVFAFDCGENGKTPCP